MPTILIFVSAFLAFILTWVWNPWATNNYSLSQLVSEEKKSTATSRSLLGTIEDKRLFYIYELDEKYTWRWPSESSDCSRNKYVKAEYGQLSGIGPLISAKDGLFLTWHFSLFSSLYNRFKRSSRRTRDPEKASLFIIPYDLSLDGYTDPVTCLNRNPVSCTTAYAPVLQANLKKSKYYRKHMGADHVLMWSLHEHHYLPRKGCDRFIKEFCSLCTITTYWMNYTKVDNRYVSIPFPSGYHWHDQIENIPWDVKNAPNRTMKAVYIGSTRTITPFHTKIRQAMTSQCRIRDSCHWLKIFHSSTDNRIGDLLSVYKKAVFCLCPPGDDPGRKAVFDSIVAGCIPVIFHESTIYNQYPWHIGEQIALDISIFIPGNLIVTEKVDLMTILNAISPVIIQQKQAALAILAPRVQYSIPPIDLLRNRSDETVWDSPFKDAADLALDGMFDRAKNVINGEATNIPRLLLSPEEWVERYKKVRIQIPGSVTT